MAEQQTPGTAPVTDQRTPPRGVLPRGAQTWLMARAGVRHSRHHRRDGPTGAGRAAGDSATNQAAAPNPDRLRDYQDRLRVLDERSRQQAQVDAIPPAAPVFYEDTGTARRTLSKRRNDVASTRACLPATSWSAVGRTASSRSQPATEGRPLVPPRVQQRRRLPRASTRSQTRSYAPARAPRQR